MPDHRNYTKLSSFYRQLYMSWRKLDGGRDLAPPKYYEDAAEEPLWGNHVIKDQSNRPILQPSLPRFPFFNVKDIWTKQPPDARTVAAKFYPQVLHAIPQSWTCLPHQEPSFEHRMPHWQARLCFFSTADTPLLLSDANTRLLYRCLISKHIDRPPCQEKWEALYGPITDKQWLSLWNFPQNMTLLQWDIAWKFLHRILPTNSVLYTAKLATTCQCPTCHQPDDTIEHVFNTCPIWKDSYGKLVSY